MWRGDEAPDGATLKDCSSGHTFSLKMKRTAHLLLLLLGITFTSTFSNSPVLQGKRMAGHTSYKTHGASLRQRRHRVQMLFGVSTCLTT